MAEQPDRRTVPAFQDLFREHYPHVVRRIMSITRDQAVAEDLAQEVFMRLYDQDLAAIDNVGGWLTQASVYAAYNHLRGEKRRMERDEQQSHGQTLDAMTAPSTEEHWFQQDEIEAVREALTDLNERDRQLLLLKYSGYGYKELARVADVDSNSVGTLLARARRRFRELYQRRRGNEA